MVRLYALILLTSCGSLEPVITDKALKPYADTIMSYCYPDNECHAHGNLDSVKFGKTASNKAIGTCYITTDGLGRESRRVVIDREYWADSDEHTRLELMAHELAHCNWNAKHSDNRDSLMHPSELHPTVPVRELFREWYFTHVKRHGTVTLH
jgi:hypothetical protein